MKTFRKILCWLAGHTPKSMMSAGVCSRCGAPNGLSYFQDGSKWTYRERYGVIAPLRYLWTKEGPY